MIHSLYIISKAGGLIYQKDFSDGLATITPNEYLVLAGTFHGVHAITSRLSPVNSEGSGIEVLEADSFRFHCFQTLTGTKFLVATDLIQANVDVVMRRIYDCYSSYAMKNPFYNPDMPIRAELFDSNIQKIIKSSV
ncbi:Sybindin-like protein [Polychytrium aggregatum]|uniref:Sybindin-like protein n=1 Tax=Polychytrium aggregatum TaxID=110093 RepID=UPI0022FDBC7C|nr:Sybindin-like protein [Polychytrium aggregatum]KAI9205955.1 Sybindin-like protein [Polychytrium aggregatum]